MSLKDFQNKSRFDRNDLQAAAPWLPKALLLPFHEISDIRWDEKSGTGRIEALRYNRPDDWFYPCHFLGDPVMPGCWGIDALWQCLRVFAAWRGIENGGRAIGLENVSFFGQIRPYDKVIRYIVEVASIEVLDGETLLTGKGSVAVDDTPVYSAGSVQVGTSFWQSEKAPARARANNSAVPFTRKLTYDQFAARDHFTGAEILAISQGTLVDHPPAEMGLLPSSLMLEVGEVHKISYDPAVGSGKILASRRTEPSDWFYPMNGGLKPTALAIDAVWQMMGLFLCWQQNAGTGRALGFERVEVFDEIGPNDGEIVYEVTIEKVTRSSTSSDTFVNADARVFAGGRPILSITNARVGCHKGIRYPDYPIENEMSLGGALKVRRD